jgi:hypothetical protein
MYVVTENGRKNSMISYLGVDLRGQHSLSSFEHYIHPLIRHMQYHNNFNQNLCNTIVANCLKHYLQQLDPQSEQLSLSVFSVPPSWCLLSLASAVEACLAAHNIIIAI